MAKLILMSVAVGSLVVILALVSQRAFKARGYWICAGALAGGSVVAILTDSRGRLGMEGSVMLTALALAVPVLVAFGLVWRFRDSTKPPLTVGLLAVLGSSATFLVLLIQALVWT
jgi:hypothetical protein